MAKFFTQIQHTLSRLSLYLPGVMMPGKNVQSIPSASPMSEGLLKRDLTESALCYNYCDVLKKGFLEKNRNPKTTQLVCESQ